MKRVKRKISRGRRVPLMVVMTVMLTGLPHLLFAQQDGGGEIDAVRQNLQKIIPERMQIGSVEQTAMEGVYHVLAGNEHMYVYSKDEFVMIGEVFDTDRRVSWTRERKDKERQVAMKDLDAMSESQMIIMGDPEGERFVTVFTDTDCGWCQKFHLDVPALEEAGLKVRYMMWPRAGLESDSYREAVSVWCADDQGVAMTQAKARQTVEPRVCENPVEEHYRLGFRLGVQGTPFIMLDDGRVLGGYVPPEKLLSEAGLLP